MPTNSIADKENSARRPPLEPRKKRLYFIIAAASILVVLGGTIGTILMQAELQRQEAVAAQEAEDAKIRAAQEAEDAKIRAAEKAKNDLVRERQGLIDELEVLLNDTVIPDHIDRGLISGSPLGVYCSPVGGGSLSDSTQTTTVLECFAQLVDNGNGTYNGRFYDATYDWSDGRYSWNLR
jgi:cell division protein FtsB